MIIAVVEGLSSIFFMDIDKQPRRTTLRDIARRTGVSVSTASLVLSNKAAERRISSDVVERVQQAASALDYSPNLLVKSLRRGQTHVLSFLNGFRNRDAHDFYMDRLSTAIERAGGALGYDILVYCDFRRSEQEMYRNLNGGRSDGLIFFAPLPTDPLLGYLRASSLPTVLINREDESGVLTSVRDDVEDGIRQIAQELARLGHRRIAMLTNEGDANPDAHARVRLLRRCLADRNIAVPDSWIIPTVESDDASVSSTLRYLVNEADPPTAIFCWHDRLGYRVLEHCSTLGIPVPDQVSVVGYDGLRWPAKAPHILASVHIDLEQIAETTVRNLDNLIHGKETIAATRKVAGALMAGTTLAAPHGF